MTASDQELIDRFIRERGVTRCPIAFTAATTATPSLPDVEQHQARGIDPVGDAYRKKPKSGWARYWAKKRAEAAA